MIVDCTMFHWEFDLLELRIKELWDVVDVFCVTESTCDHRGKDRELVLTQNLDRFDWAKEKLHVNVSEKNNDSVTTWDHEKYQRYRSVADAVKKFDIRENDFIIMSDVDEIPRSISIKDMASHGGRFTMHMPMYYYYLNLYVHDWFHPKAFSAKYLTDPNMIRSGGYDGESYIVYDSGWHFSYLGDENQIQYKLKTFAHDEFDRDEITNVENIKNAISSNSDLFGRFGDEKFLKQELTDYWPKYVTNNVDKYSKYILK